MSVELVGKILASRYRVDKLIGRGGMAEVYQAWDVRRQYYVAVKVMREDIAEDLEFLRRFRVEAETLAGLSHANIVRFYSFERDGALAFLIMDYVPGITLRRRILELEGAPLPMQEVVSITRQICAALHYAHEEGMIHRDVKTGNIMLRPDGQVLLSDFGIAKAADSTTVTAMMPGTPAYMSPEQCLSRPLDLRSDIYSLGVVLFEMLTGRRPFIGEAANVTGTTSEKVRWEHLKTPPPPLRPFNPAVSPELEAVVLKCLQKKRNERYDNVLEFLQDFEQALKPAASVKVGIPTGVATAVHRSQKEPTGSKIVSSSAPPVVPSQPRARPVDVLPSAPPAKRSWLSIGLAIAGISIIFVACLGILVAIVLGSFQTTAVNSQRTAEAQGTALMNTIAVGHQTETAALNSTLTAEAGANAIMIGTPFVQVTANPLPSSELIAKTPVLVMTGAPAQSMMISPLADSSEGSQMMIDDWLMGNFLFYKGECKFPGNPCWMSTDNWRIGYDEITLISNESIIIPTGWDSPHLVFWHKYQFDLSAEIDVQVNGRWVLLKKYGQGSKDWTMEALDVSKYRDEEIIIRFTLQPYREASHWFLQDMQIVPDYRPAP